MWWAMGFGAGLVWFLAAKLGFDRLIEQRMSPWGNKIFRAFILGSFVVMWFFLAAVLAELVWGGHWGVAAGLFGGMAWFWRSRLRKYERRGPPTP